MGRLPRSNKHGLNGFYGSFGFAAARVAACQLLLAVFFNQRNALSGERITPGQPFSPFFKQKVNCPVLSQARCCSRAIRKIRSIRVHQSEEAFPARVVCPSEEGFLALMNTD